MDGLIAMLKRFLLALALILPGAASHALDIAVVVTACGTPPTTYVPGQSFAITQDITGLLCSSGSGGGGGGASAKATAADPTYVEGTLNPLSLNLSGYQRVQVPSSQLITTGTAGSPSSQVLSVQGVPSMTPIQDTLVPQSGNGCTPGHLITTASTNTTDVTNAATTLCWINAENPSTTAVADVRVYDKGSNINCGTDSSLVKQNFPISEAPASGLIGGIVPSLASYGMVLVNGFHFCVTGANADNDTTNAPANVLINYAYK
jgi:hypothetical protein